MTLFYLFLRRILPLGAILFFCIGFVFGETKPDVRGFNSGVFDYHFRKADRERIPERWMAEARQGIVMARNAWELTAAELYGDKVLLEEAGKTIEAWSEAELEERFTAWLLRRFFSAGIAEQTEHSAQAIREKNLALVYHLDENGRIRYDEETGDPLVIRPHETGGYLEGDRNQWRENTREIINAGTAQYEARLIALFPELLEYVPEKNREAFAEKLWNITDKAVAGRQKEFEALAAREERLFVARRTGDVWSLRKKSEDEAAIMITTQLIEETEILCAQGIAALETRIEAAETGNGDLVLAGAEWLEAYREQFERGLKAWADAEERFFVRRIEWEQEAGRYYLEGEEAWSNAFERFEQQRRNWEAKTKVLFESGAAIFRLASENLEAAIAGAKAEFEQDLLLRTEAGAERAKAWVDTYIICGSVAAGAQENIDFWLDQYGKQNAPALAGGGFSQWISVEMANHWRTIQSAYERQYSAGDQMSLLIKDIIAGKTTKSQEQETIERLEKMGINFSASFKTARELKNWSDLYDSYFNKAKTARDALINDFSMVMGTGALKDILDQGVVSEDFNLDEYQIELIRAKAVAAYWEKRKEIAQGVVSYAEELSAGRMTDSEGLKAWEQAKQSYDDALSRYETELSRLNAAGIGVKEAQQTLNNTAAALREAEKKLDEKNQAYTIIMAAYAAGRNDFVLDELVSKYKELLQKYNLLTTEGDNAAYIRYLERAYELGFAVELETAGQMLQQLIQGGEGIGKSLSALTEGASKIKVYEAFHIIPETIEKFGLEEDDPFYSIIKDLLSEKKEKLAGPGDQEKIQAYYNQLISAMTKTAKAQAQVQVETRIKALDLFVCNSTMDWYFDLRGYEPETADREFFLSQGLEACLTHDVEKDARAFLQARLALEVEGLSCFLGENTGGERAKLLSNFCAVDATEAAEILKTLKALQLLLNSAAESGSADYNDALENAARLEETAAWFLRGGSCFTAQSGQLIGYGLLETELTAAARSQSLLGLYQLIGVQAAPAARETGLRGLREMGEFFTSYGIAVNDTYLPGIKSVGDAIMGMEGSLSHNLSTFLSRLNGPLGLLPPWIKAEMETWQASLITYMAAKTIYNKDGITGSGDDIKNEIETITEQFQAVQFVAETLQYADPESARVLCAVLRLPPELFVSVNKTVIENEAVKRIGRDLARQYGGQTYEDEDALWNILSAGCLADHEYAPEGVRKKSVDEAIRLLGSGSPDDEIQMGDYFHKIIAQELPLVFNTLSGRREYLNYQYALLTAYRDMDKTIKDAEREGRSHWRQYLSAEFLEDYNKRQDNEKIAPGILGNPEGTYNGIKAAQNWREGVLADAYEKAAQDTRRLNDAFRFFVNAGEQPADESIKAEIKKYQDNPLLEWDETILKTVDYVFYDNYYTESAEFQKHYVLEAALQKEIEQLGMGYYISKQSGAGIKAELTKISGEITGLESGYDLAGDRYRNSALDFAAAGAAYDEAYKALKKDYRDLEEARTAYEKEDAIRRWASTAYLNNDPGTAGLTADYKTPYEDLSYSTKRYERAVIALNALAGLYNQEERRPYADGEYEKLYNTYQESFQRMLLSIKTLSMLEDAIAQEMKTNSTYYDNYNRYLNELGGSINYSPNYQPPDDKSLWQLMDLIQIKDGKLGFAYNDSFQIQKMTGGQAEALKSFFSPLKQIGIEINMASQFEAALRLLSQYIVDYEISTDASKYIQWGLARDYLLSQLIANNGEIKSMADWYSPVNALNPDENLGSMPIGYGGTGKDPQVGNAAVAYRAVELSRSQKDAWDRLSSQEKTDLEFYTILTLLGNGGRESKGFSYISAQSEYRNIVVRLDFEKSRLKRKLWIPVARHFYRAGLERLNATTNHILPAFYYINDTIERAKTGLETTVTSLNSAFSLYAVSCNRLAALNGVVTGNGNVRWDTVKGALQTAGGLTADEIQRIEKYWYEMEKDAKGSYQNTLDALKELIRWSRNKKEDDKKIFEQAWIEDELIRLENQTVYRDVFNAYVEGTADITTLNKAAAAAYGNKAPARKNHLENLEQTIIQDLKGITENGASYKDEYAGLAGELTELIQRAYAARYNAELTARQLEWDMQRYDIQEKYRSWVEASNLILERGRADWKTGMTKMRESYARWINNFNEEYKETGLAWTAAYLTGLEDKARWVEMATEAAQNSAAGALLAMVGSEAEMMSRRMDTRSPSGKALTAGMEEAENTLRQLFENTGLMNVETAFAAINGIAGTITSQVRQGIGGPAVWNSAVIQAAALALAKETNEELAAREAKKVAACVQQIVQEALANLVKGVDEANENFDENMDDFFILEGQWRRSGQHYIKDIIVHSTLFDPVITEGAMVKGYEYYKMAPIKLSVSLDESRLQDLDALAVQALINNMYTEIQGIAQKIFGADEKNAGLFTEHIGEGPEVKPDVNADMEIHELFSDDGTGELGRLLRLYIYWSLKERNGINAMNSALWEKPLWDSRNSRFDAPSIRSVVDVGMQVTSTIVATVVGAVAGAFSGGAGFVLAAAINSAVNLTDDLMFSALDVSGGYKSWDEAGVEFGKKTVITAAGALIGGAFNGIGAAAGSALGASSSSFLQSGITGMVTNNLTGISRVMARTALAGIQTITTGTVTSALNAVTYSSRDGFGFSRDVFIGGMKSASIGALSGMTGSFTTGMMNLGLEGFYDSFYADGEKLSSLAGGLTGQGVNYAFNGDYTLNLLNLDLLTNGTINSGVLELHLGRGGLNMGLGTGGVDVSAGTMFSALRGLEAWKVNAQLLTSKEKNARQYARQMRTLYSGDAVTKAEFEAVLEGRTRYVENQYAGGTESIYDGDTGIKTVFLGMDALEDGSRFGLNVVFSHEAYRNGRDDGIYGQFIEGNNAAAGHIRTALGLMETYGADSLSAGLQGEAFWYQYALTAYDYSILEAALGAYDSGRDFWQLTDTGGLTYDGSGYLRDVDGLYINYDGTKTEEPVKDGVGRTVGASGIETGLLRILNLELTKENITAVQDMMMNAGLLHTSAPHDQNNRALWMWKGPAELDAHNSGITIDNSFLREFGMFYLPESMFSMGGDIAQANKIKETVFQSSLNEEWQPKDGTTYCNMVFLDAIEAILGKNKLTQALKQAGVANEIGLYLDANYHKLSSELMAQITSNFGHFVAIAYVNPGYLETADNDQYHGHMGTVVAHYGTYIPALGPRISQGGAKNGEYWTRDPMIHGRVMNHTSFYTIREAMAKTTKFKKMSL
jgi:hypothetical protein